MDLLTYIVQNYKDNQKIESWVIIYSVRKRATSTCEDACPQTHHKYDTENQQYVQSAKIYLKDFDRFKHIHAIIQLIFISFNF